MDQPKFCFACGSPLTELHLGWMQCTNEECADCFLPFVDEGGNQCLMKQWTPLDKTPNPQADEGGES